MAGIPRVNKRHGWIRAGYTKKPVCERCDETNMLCVHHKDRNPFNNIDFSNLETLCRTCHNREHAAETKINMNRPEIRARISASLKGLPRRTSKETYSKNGKKAWEDPNGALYVERASYEGRKKRSLAMLDNSAKRRTITSRCSTLINSGISDDEIWAILQREYGQRAKRKHVISEVRFDMKSRVQ